MNEGVLVPQLCLTLCDPIDWSPPGSSVHGIFQARILEWVAISISRNTNISSVKSLSHVQLFATPWTAPCQASLSITNSQSLPKFMSIESVMPFNHLIFYHPLLLLPSILPRIRVFSNELVLCFRWPKYLEFQLQYQSFQQIFRIDFLYDGLVGFPCCPRDSQESSPTPQFKSINSSVLRFLYSLNSRVHTWPLEKP